MMQLIRENKTFIFKVFVIFIFVLLASGSFRGGKHKASKSDNQNVITVTGQAEVYSAPDIAEVSFTIRKEAKVGADAQSAVAEVEKKALDFLAESKVEKKDIKAQSVSLYPKYEYQYGTRALYPCNEFGCPPVQGKNVIVGYEASENITVKIRNLADTGKIVEGLGKAGVSDLNGPNFKIENEDGLKAEARKDAIDKAKAKAKVLAKDLGVRLGRVVSFNEGADYGGPILYSKASLDSAVASSAPAELPKGENTITSNVTIVYEIR